MSFFDKLKRGVSDTTALAKVTVEVNRLKLQISSKKKEIIELQTNIGILVYEQFTDSVDRQEEISLICARIQEKHFDMDMIREKIDALSDEKKCVCGITLARSTRFCPECGHKFPEERIHITESEPVLTLEASHEVEAADVTSMFGSDDEDSIGQCPECAEVLEVDAKFCGNCGTTVHLP
jgi:NADH pyrophosphatase NudC (nudix superfamily)